MKILATAKRNKKYLWEKTFEKCAIVAALENDHITFLEYHNNHVNTLSEERVKSLFPKEINLEIEVPIRECPFLVEENQDFYAILNRKIEPYKTRYLKILFLENGILDLITKSQTSFSKPLRIIKRTK